jgi:hypothetical protein
MSRIATQEGFLSVTRKFGLAKLFTLHVTVLSDDILNQIVVHRNPNIDVLRLLQCTVAWGWPLRREMRTGIA